MADSRLDIGSFAGYKGEESPRVFFAHGEKITVMKVITMWTEEAEQDRSRRRFFTVEGSDGFIHTLYHDVTSDAWFYRGFEKKTRPAT